MGEALVALKLVAGLVLLVGGSAALVRGASRLATAAGVPPLIMALTRPRGRAGCALFTGMDKSSRLHCTQRLPSFLGRTFEREGGSEKESVLEVGSFRSAPKKFIRASATIAAAVRARTKMVLASKCTSPPSRAGAVTARARRNGFSSRERDRQGDHGRSSEPRTKRSHPLRPVPCTEERRVPASGRRTLVGRQTRSIAAVARDRIGWLRSGRDPRLR